jgi:heme-degrading monooxygenase HmoA
MAITRIFRVQIHAELRSKFEEEFADVSASAVEAAGGLLSIQILKPTLWSPDEYAMISQWQDEASLQAFAGVMWNRAVIPAGMDRFVRSCGVCRSESWD